MKRYKLDMHCHTQFMDLLPSRALFHYIRRKRKADGLDGICVMNHDFFSDVAYYQSFGAFVGEETTVKSRGKKWHIGFLGIKERIPPNYPVLPSFFYRRRSAEQVIAEARSQGGISILHHPDSFELYDAVDVVEVMNGKHLELTESIIREWQCRYIAGNFKPVCGGSDFHFLLNDRTNYPYTVLLLDSEPTLENIIRALKRGNSYVTVGPDISFFVEDAYPGIELPFQKKVRIGIKSTYRGNVFLFSNDRVILAESAPCDITRLIELSSETYLRIEMRDGTKVLLVTNPIILH